MLTDFEVRVLTSTRLMEAYSVISLRFMGYRGETEIFKDHASFIMDVKPGPLTLFFKEKTPSHFFVWGGVCWVTPKGTQIFVERMVDISDTQEETLALALKSFEYKSPLPTMWSDD